MSTIKYPDMRLELLSNLLGLSDPTYQQLVWVEQRPWGTVEHDEFDNAVHFLFDDTKLSEDAHSYIGVVLINALEAERVTDLTEVLGAIFSEYGVSLTDAQYMALPEWNAVVEAAEAALAVIPHSEWAHLRAR